MNHVDRLFAVFSSNFLLFITCGGIWGSTWLVIKHQLNGADPVASVFYRFLIATTILFVFALASGKSMNYSRKFHWNFFLQGSCNFSINYIITYWAEQYAPSATIALAFTLLVAYNILGMKIFFRKPISNFVYLGAVLGIVGVSFIFSHELLTLDGNSQNIHGLGLGVIATFFASAGNLLSYRNHLHRVPVTISNAWGMFYGTLMTLCIALILRKPLTVSLATSYWVSMLYLSIFGTVIAFGAFLTLVGRIGAEQAGYTSILSPAIAVGLSIFFEDFKVSLFIGIGLALCLLGNVVTLYGNRKPARSGF